MSSLAHFRHFKKPTEFLTIEERGAESWWVSRQKLSWDGSVLPFSRIVYFARSKAEAERWIEREYSTGVNQCNVGSDPEIKRLRLSA